MPRNYRKALREVKVNTEQEYQKPQPSGMLGQLGVCHQEVVWPCLSQILLVFAPPFFPFFFCGLGCCRLNREQGQEKKADPIMGWFWETGGRRSPAHGRNRIFVAGY